jgi:hypothetical protein
MTDLKLYSRISSLPESLRMELVEFINTLESKRKRSKFEKRKIRTFGYAKDKIVLKPGFDDPIDDFKEYM